MTTELTPFAEITAPRADPAGTAPQANPALGRLVVVADWLAARRDDRGPLSRPRVVVLTGAHEGDGWGAAELLAEAHGAGFVLVEKPDLGVPGPDTPAGDLLDQGAAVASIERGRQLADREIDGGADLLIPGLGGRDHTLALGVLTAVLTGLEPVDAVAVADTDPTRWVAAVTDLRDTLFRLRDRDKDVVSLIAAVGGADFGTLTGLLAQASVRRTPVLLDGLPATVAAVLAHRLAPGAEGWFLAAGQAVGRPGRRLQDMLGLPLVAALETDSPAGAGAVLVLPLIQAALTVTARQEPAVADAPVSLVKQ